VKRALFITAVALGGMLLSQCATEGGGSAGFYGGYYYDDYWYGGGGCCIEYPGDIGPPHPEHPIASPPGESSRPKPSHPIATPPSRPMPSPRPAAMPRGGGGGRR